MSLIKQDDLVQSVADALQYISYYHPVDYIKGFARAQAHARELDLLDRGDQAASLGGPDRAR